MTRSRLVILIWILLLPANVILMLVMQDAQAPMPPIPTGMPLGMSVLFDVLPFLFFVGCACFIPRSPWSHPQLAAWADARYGAGALDEFLAALKPMLLFGFSGLLQAAIFVLYDNGKSPLSGTIGFIVSGGLGFIVAHVILYYRKVPGVYPQAGDKAMEAPASSVPTQSGPLPLREAIARYWYYLIGIGLFAPIAATLEALHAPFYITAIFFYAAAFTAAYPVMRKWAPYSFWIVAGGVFMAGGVLSIFLVAMLRVLLTNR